MRRLLGHLAAWCRRQPGARLVTGPPLSDRQIDGLPRRMERVQRQLAVPFHADQLVIPTSYRKLLRLHRFVRIELEDEDGEWNTYEPFNLLAPDEVARGPAFIDYATLDERPIFTTFLVAFATAGYESETSRWCFYTDGDLPAARGELPILCEANDFECDLAKFVDDRTWVPGAFTTPAAPSFAKWLERLVELVMSQGFDEEKSTRDDAIANGFYGPG
jgi:hypothetical protein